MFMCGNLDPWEAELGIGGSIEQDQAMVAAARPMCDGIAQQLARAVELEGVPNWQRWQQMVEAACRRAIVEIPDGKIVRLGQNPSFAPALAKATRWVTQ